MPEKEAGVYFSATDEASSTQRRKFTSAAGFGR
jgi:hypothetical protein